MRLTAKGFKYALNRGGVWIMLVNKAEMGVILSRLKAEQVHIQAMECETVEDAIKTKLLIDAFNTWTLEAVREFIKSNTNFPKIDEL